MDEEVTRRLKRILNDVSYILNHLNGKSKPHRKDNSAAKEIFQFWNSKRIITHRNFEKMARHINAALKLYSLEEIKTAIENYATVLFGVQYYWTHKWTLDQFLSRKNGLDRFLLENFHAEDYLKDNEKAFEEFANGKT